MTSIKESISSFDYRRKEIFFKSLSLYERQKVLRSLKTEQKKLKLT